MMTNKISNPNLKSLSGEELIHYLSKDEKFFTWIMDEVIPTRQALGEYTAPWQDRYGYELQQEYLAICGD